MVEMKGTKGNAKTGREMVQKSGGKKGAWEAGGTKVEKQAA